MTQSNTYKTNSYKIRGMHCASCAGIIEKTLKKTDGVISAEANYGPESVKVSFDHMKINPEALSAKIAPLGYSLIVPTAEEMGMSPNEHAAHLGLNQSKKEKLLELGEMKTKVVVSIPLTIFSIFVMGWEILAEFHIIREVPYIWSEFFHHLLPIMATYMLCRVGCGRRTCRRHPLADRNRQAQRTLSKSR